MIRIDKICHVTQESSKKKPQKKNRSQRWSKETLTTESSGTPKPSSPSSSSQVPKASSSSSLFKGLPPTTGLRFFPDRPVSLLPFRMGVSSACPSRSRLRTMAASLKKGRGGLDSSKLDLYWTLLDWFLGRSCRCKLNLRSIQPNLWNFGTCSYWKSLYAVS